MLNPKLSLQIMGVWIWMEKSGFIDTVEKIQTLPLDLIRGLADEAVLCIDFFKNAQFPTPSELINSIPLIHFLMKKEIHLMFLPVNRASAIEGMKKVLNDVCVDLEVLYSEARMMHDTFKQNLVQQEMAQITRSFNLNVSLEDTAALSNLSPHNSELSGSGLFDFGLGSSSLLQRGSSSSEPGTFNVGSSKSWNSVPGQVNSPPHNAANFGLDPIKAILPGSPVSPHGYVGMGRSASNRGDKDSGFVNKGIDAPNQVLFHPKPDAGMIRQPRLARSNSFHRDAPTPRMTRGPSLSNSGHQILNPATRGCSSALIPQFYPQQNFLIPATFVPAEQRTLFVTFSKGYRVHEAELMEYMTNWLGNCIESLQMQETSRDEQPLYARLVFYNPEIIDTILKGEERYKFSINGKHVWVRKYIVKNQRNNPNF